LIISQRVRGVMARSRSSGFRRKPFCSAQGTMTGTPPQIKTMSAYVTQ
jgi:hypothetical protein